MIGKINEPVKLQAQQAGDWIQTAGPKVNLRIELDKTSASFTPSENGVYKFKCGNQEFIVEVGQVTPEPEPEPEPTPEPTPGTLLYDSNVDIDWAAMDGKTIEIGKPYGDPTKPNTKYIRMNASGSPKIIFNAVTKEMTLAHGGKYGRAYFGVCNYQSRLEIEFKLDSCSNNCSLKTRNQHQYNEYLRSIGQPEISDPIGGQGCAIGCSETDADFEITHGGGEASGPSASVSPKLEANKYYKLKFSQFDENGKIHIIEELDRQDGQGFKKILDGFTSPPSRCFDKASFEKWSEFWVRLNTGDSGGKLVFKNLKLFAL